MLWFWSLLDLVLPIVFASSCRSCGSQIILVTVRTLLLHIECQTILFVFIWFSCCVLFVSASLHTWPSGLASISPSTNRRNSSQSWLPPSRCYYLLIWRVRKPKVQIFDYWFRDFIHRLYTLLNSQYCSQCKRQKYPVCPKTIINFSNSSYQISER